MVDVEGPIEDQSARTNPGSQAGHQLTVQVLDYHHRVKAPRRWTHSVEVRDYEIDRKPMLPGERTRTPHPLDTDIDTDHAVAERSEEDRVVAAATGDVEGPASAGQTVLKTYQQFVGGRGDLLAPGAIPPIPSVGVSAQPTQTRGRTAASRAWPNLQPFRSTVIFYSRRGGSRSSRIENFRPAPGKLPPILHNLESIASKLRARVEGRVRRWHADLRDGDGISLSTRAGETRWVVW